jgi:hypothetical protein
MMSFIDFLGQSTLREEHSMGMLQTSVQRRLHGPKSTLREEHSMGMLQTSVQRRPHGPKRSNRGMEKIT